MTLNYCLENLKSENNSCSVFFSFLMGTSGKEKSSSFPVLLHLFRKEEEEEEKQEDQEEDRQQQNNL